ncbi:DUF6443 domain-containing protein [Chryseolinea sp. H1M3-3]|uniref:DUF6443 domain-containing protein n=1 Tax=Chryseolinea sp. H1M3-3 TaxID=3034144 RepID=UPI0023EBCC01|nr:DUF6443 domain-containing protein [Chryseolinea sp. H1M3-3]
MKKFCKKYFLDACRNLVFTYVVILFLSFDAYSQCTTPSPSSQSGCPNQQYTLTVTSINISVTSHRWYTAPSGGTQISPTTNASISNGWQSTYTNVFSSSVTYYVAAVCSGTEMTTRVPVSFTNSGSTLAISTSSDPMAVTPGASVALTASSTGASYQWRYGNTVSAIIGNTTINATKGGTYYASGNNNCGTLQSGSIQVNFLPVADAGPDKTVIGTTCTIYGSGSDQDEQSITFSWTKILPSTEVTMTGANTSNLSISGLPTTGLPQTFVFRLTVTDASGRSHADDVNVAVTSSTNNNNYVLTEAVKIPGQTTNAQVAALTIPNKAMTYGYSDGLGKPLQTINRQASPSSTDLIQAYEYDPLQRQKNSYLPVQQSQTNGMLIGNLLGNGNYVNSTHYTVYNSGIAGVQADSKAYSSVEFEASPLGRATKQGSVGTGFQPNENDVDVSYGTNGLDIRLWTISSNLPGSTTVWEANLLLVITSTDPQGIQSQEITTRQGLKILTRTNMGGGSWAETYYVYDNRNNLRFVLPPELIRIIKTGTFRNPTQAEIDTWAYQMVYDNEGRVIEAKGPGKTANDWSYSIYDKRDRVVLTQDPKQRLGNEWSYTKYDDFNRPVISGIYRPGSAISRATMQANIDALNSNQGYQNISPQTTSGVKAALDIVIKSYEGINDYRAINSIVIKPGFTFTAGVTSTSFLARIDDGSSGTSADAFPKVNDEPLAITFYDDYKQCGICQDANFGFSSETWVGTSNEAFSKTDFVKDQVIAGSTKILGTNTQWLHTVSYFNRNGEVIQTIFSDHLGGRQRSSTLVDFTGKALENLTTYSGLNIGVSTVRRRFVYDNSDRLLKTYHRINSQPEVVLTALDYNPVGQLIDKKIHSADNGSTYLQSIDYSYNIRGDLLKMNSTSGTDVGDPTDYFGIEFARNNVFGAMNTPRYDGFISGIKWRTDLPDATLKVMEKGYTYSYNNLGFISSSTYKQNIFGDGTSNWDQPQNSSFNEDGIQYDYNGNIQQLARKTKTGPTSVVIDQLQYNYGSSSGNKLFYVTDSAPAGDKDKGFNDGNISGDDYEYDVNGNLTKDRNKNINTITYNFQNLPDRITFGDNSYIQYTYDASGKKLSQVYYNAASQTSLKTDYVNDLVLVNDQFQFLLHEEGRVVSPDYNNLVPTPAREANGTEGYTASGTVTITSEPLNTQTYVKAVCNQSTSTPGVLPIGNATYPVKPGESYSFKVLGYQSVGNSAKLYVASTTNDIIWPGVELPQGAANETWVTATFIVPSGVTQIKLGALWQTPVIGSTFYINRVALYKTDFEYQYFLTDQVGSARVVLGTTPSTLTYTATMETENHPNETTSFFNLDASRYTPHPSANSTPGGTKALLMDNNYRVGPARDFKVFPGDRINATVQSYYQTGTYSGQLYAAMTSAVADVISGGNTAVTDGVALAYNNSVNQLPGFALSTNSPSTSKPSAFINYILFDESYKPLEAKSQPLGGANVRQLITLPEISVKERGFVFIYLSYDDQGSLPAYFDDFKITYTESPVIQINDYYAFGLSSTEWVRDGEEDNNFLFQGKEVNNQTGLHDFHARQYDAVLGRWLVNDPKAQFTSPYIGMGNNPVLMVDPDGEFAFVPVIIGAVIGAYSGGTIANNGEMNPGNWDYQSGKTWKYMGAGAVVGGVSGGLGAEIAASGMAFSNTTGILFSSSVNAIGTGFYTGGEVVPNISFGFASYSILDNQWGFLGKKGNSAMDNFSYTMGAVANVSDILAGFKPGNVELRTENDPGYYKSLDAEGNPIPRKDLIGHSQIVDEKGKILIDWGPVDGVDGFGDWVTGTNSYEGGSAIALSKMKWGPIKITGVNVDRITKFSEKMAESGNSYNLVFNSCVSMTSRALNMSGVLNIGIHPYILHAQMHLRSIGFRPSLFSYHLQNR